MDAEREKQLLDDVALIKSSLVGNLDGKKGALHTIEMLMDEVYNPTEPYQSLRARVRRIEEKQARESGEKRGWNTAFGVVGGVIALIGKLLIDWITGGGSKH